MSGAIACGVITIAALLSGCQSTENGPLVGMSLPEPDNMRASSNYTQTEYRISASDTLDINVYQFEKLGGTVQVDGAGRISLPLIGAMQAAGRTTSELEAELSRRLGARYLQAPQVAVFVKESVGRQITVYGAVKKPGVYNLKGKTTLLRAVALAEGMSDIGDTSTVTLARTIDQKRVTVQYDLSSIRAGGAEDPVVYGGDTVIVDESVGRHALQVLKATIPAAVGIGSKVIP